jgi:GT2 family glycosyltransferase
MIDLDIVIVNWNTGAQLQECLQSIALASPASVLRLRQCVVVDNASVDGSAFDLEHQWSSLDLHVERLPSP